VRLLRYSVAQIVYILLSLIIILFASVHAELEAMVFPVLENITMSPLRRNDDDRFRALIFRMSFDKVREGEGRYSAWAMYGDDGRRYLFVPLRCDTMEFLQGSITAKGTHGSLDMCTKIPADLRGKPFTISAILFYRVWHSGVIPMMLPLMRVES
jgi:hypothetical protein